MDYSTYAKITDRLVEDRKAASADITKVKIMMKGDALWMAWNLQFTKIGGV